MAPKILMTAEEVKREIENTIGQDCLMSAHFVDGEGNCSCGTFHHHEFFQKNWMSHFMRKVGELNDADSI